MKRKNMSIEQYEKMVSPNEKILYGDTSPVTIIRTPPKTVFTAWHGVLPIVGYSSVCGNMYICRTDSSDTVDFNFDKYSFLVNDSSILQIQKEKDSSFDFHWTDNPPEFLMSRAPQRIIDKIDAIKNKGTK